MIDDPYRVLLLFRIVKQQLAFLKTVENKLKGALGNSKSYSGSGENFNSAVSFALPERAQYSKLTDSALWNLGEPVQYTREDGELDEEDFDELDDIREELLKITLMTPEKQRQWASSAPEMKEVCGVSVRARKRECGRRGWEREGKERERWEGEMYCIDVAGKLRASAKPPNFILHQLFL